MEKRGESYFISDNKNGSEPRRLPQGLDPDEQPERQLSMFCHGQVSKNVAPVDQGIKLIAAKGALGDIETRELFTIVNGILNKLSESTFTTLLQQVLVLKIDTEVKLRGTVDLIYEKAINEPESSEACASMCLRMTMLRVESDEGTTSKEETIEFRKVILTKCQKGFEKNSLDEEQFLELKRKRETNEDADLASQLKKEYKLAIAKSLRHRLGNIRFIGELFKLRMLTENIMYGCIKALFKAEDENNLELLCLLLKTIGKDIDHSKSKKRMDQYFAQISKVIQEKRISSRLRLILQDVYDLRMSNWDPHIVAPTAERSPELTQTSSTDELEEVFRFLVELIPDPKEWKHFAKHGLGLDKSVYQVQERQISKTQKLGMLRFWKSKQGEGASVQKLCSALRGHFAGRSMLVNAFKAVMSPLVEGQKRLCNAVEGLNVSNLSITNHGTWTTKDAFMGCEGTTVHY